MYRIRILLVGILLLLFGVQGTTQAVLAAQAQPYHLSGCDDLGGGYVYCYESRGVITVTETPSGNFASNTRDTTTYTVSLDGAVIETGQRKSHFVNVNKGSQAQVDRFNGSDAFSHIDSDTGQTISCTYTFNFIYANGAIRHDVDNLDCS
jgi:hypothetical protein